MFALNWNRSLPRKRFRSLHEALFVLEKNVSNLGTSNRSYSGLLEHKEALQFLTGSTSYGKDRNGVEKKKLLQGAVKLLDINDSSALSCLKHGERKEFILAALVLVGNILSGMLKRCSNARPILTMLNDYEIFSKLERLIKEFTDFSILDACKKVLLALADCVPYNELKKESFRDFILCVGSLIRQFEVIKMRASSEELGSIFYHLYRKRETREIFSSYDLDSALRAFVLFSLKREDKISKKKQDFTTIELIQLLSRFPISAKLLLEYEASKKIIDKFLGIDNSQNERRLAVDALKNLIKTEEIEGVELYENILKRGGVKSLDEFLIKSDNNKSFTQRMKRQQKLKRTLRGRARTMDENSVGRGKLIKMRSFQEISLVKEGRDEGHDV